VIKASASCRTELACIEHMFATAPDAPRNRVLGRD
jgi:hypothetical protein